MKRPLCVVGFSFSIAMAAAFFFSGGMAFLLCVAALLSGFAVRLWKREHVTLWAVLLAVAAAFGWYSAYHARHIAPFAQARGQTVAVQGLVTAVRVNTRSVQYLLEARFPERPLPSGRAVLYSFGESQAAVGDIVALTARIEPAEGRYYANNAIRVTGVAQSPIICLAPEEMGSAYVWQRAVLRIRQTFLQNLYQKLPKASADILGTMVLNVGAELDAEMYNHMNRSGISHILSISGMHFSVIVAFVLTLLQRLSLPRRVPEIITLLFGAGFVAVTGFSPAIVRSFVMFLVLLLGQMSFRQGDSLNALGCGLLLSCCIWPEWSCSLGLQLSAAATLGILLLGRRFYRVLFLRMARGTQHRWYKALVQGVAGSIGISGAAYLFTLPLLLYSNGWIPTYSIPTNLLVAPLTAPVMLGGLLCALIPGQGAILRGMARLTDISLQIILRLSQAVAALPLSAFALDNSWKLIWLVLVLGVAIALVRLRPAKKRVWSAVLLCVVVFQAGVLGTYAAGRSRVELITLPECRTAVLLRGREAVLLGTPDRYQINRLLKYLDFRGVEQVSALVMPDGGDNLNPGVLLLQQRYPPGAVLAPADSYRAGVLAQALKTTAVYPGGEASLYVLDGVTITSTEAGTICAEGAGWRLYKLAEPWTTDTPPAAPETGAIAIDGDGILLLPPGLTLLPEPVGQYIYGEKRLRLPV